MIRYTRLLFLIISIYNAYCYTVYVGSTGLLFPYTLGALAYLKSQDYNKINLIGTSGGAWCSLIFCLENNAIDHDELWETLVGEKSSVLRLYCRENMEQFQNKLSDKLLRRYKHLNISDIKLSIVVTKITSSYCPESLKITKFENLKDIIGYCLCSSYIPCICGKSISKEYKNEKYVDGQLFLSKSHMRDANMIIDKYSWNRNYNTNFCLNYTKSKQLFEEGWMDAKKNV